jgi:imidazoleglycerol-phosphate dehydratase
LDLTAVEEHPEAESQLRLPSCSTELPFFDHMLEAMAFHAGFDMVIKARGDVELGGHHVVEDTGLALGQALKRALGEGRGITRFGHAFVPMDEALVAAVVDISGRPYLAYELEPEPRKFGRFHTDLVEEFLRAFAFQAGLTLHVRQQAGRNAHHIVEACFKALGRALAVAVSLEGSADRIPSTKGTLGEDSDDSSC